MTEYELHTLYNKMKESKLRIRKHYEHKNQWEKPTEVTRRRKHKRCRDSYETFDGSFEFVNHSQQQRSQPSKSVWYNFIEEQGQSMAGASANCHRDVNRKKSTEKGVKNCVSIKQWRVIFKIEVLLSARLFWVYLMIQKTIRRAPIFDFDSEKYRRRFIFFTKKAKTRSTGILGKMSAG